MWRCPSSGPLSSSESEMIHSYHSPLEPLLVLPLIKGACWPSQEPSWRRKGHLAMSQRCRPLNIELVLLDEPEGSTWQRGGNGACPQNIRSLFQCSCWPKTVGPSVSGDTLVLLLMVVKWLFRSHSLSALWPFCHCCFCISKGWDGEGWHSSDVYCHSSRVS